jgi:hypothetical protein
MKHTIHRLVRAPGGIDNGQQDQAPSRRRVVHRWQMACAQHSVDVRCGQPRHRAGADAARGERSAGPTAGDRTLLPFDGHRLLKSVQRLDLSRLKVEGAWQIDRWRERGHIWSEVNWSKRDVTVDLNQRASRDLVAKQLTTCNVSWRITRRRSSRSSSSPPTRYGRSTPTSSLSACRRGRCNPLAGHHALFATMVALWRRELGHGGCMVVASAIIGNATLASNPTFNM